MKIRQVAIEYVLKEVCNNVGELSKVSRRPCDSWGFPPRQPGFESRSGHVRFVVDKVALGQVFSEYFDFLCQFLFHRLLHIYHPSCRAGTKGHLVADVPSESYPTPRKKGKPLNMIRLLCSLVLGIINYYYYYGSTAPCWAWPLSQFLDPVHSR
jgi:hypothetical protein